MSDLLSKLISTLAKKEASLLDKLVTEWCSEHGRWPRYAWIVTTPVGDMGGPLERYKIEARCSDTMPGSPAGVMPLAVYDLAALNATAGEA